MPPPIMSRTRASIVPLRWLATPYQRQRFRRWWDISFLVLGGGALVVGFVGFEACLSSTGEPLSRKLVLATSALKTFQLFVLEGSAEDLCNARTWVAAFAAPAATLGAVIAAFGPGLNRWRESMCLHFRSATDVFLGSGDLAAGIAMRQVLLDDTQPGGESGLGRTLRLVGLDLNAETPLGRLMENLDMLGGSQAAGKSRVRPFHGFTRTGDALSTRDLMPLRLHAAQRVWVCAGADHVNLEIARRVLVLLAQRKSARKDDPLQRMHLLVSVYDPHLIRARHALFPEKGNSSQQKEGDASQQEKDSPSNAAMLEFFCLPRMAARVLLSEHLPQVPQGEHSPHLLIIGASDLAAALVVHAAQHCVYDTDPQHCVRITLVGTGVQAMHERLLMRFPALASHRDDDPSISRLLPLARIQVLECGEDDLLHGQWLRLQAPQAFSAVYVACDSDLRTMSAATRAASLREITKGATLEAQPIVACLQQSRGSLCAASSDELRSHFLGCTPGEDGTPAHWIELFDVFERCIQPGENYPGEKRDSMAMQVRWAYEDKAVPADPSREPREIDETWLKKHEQYRWSDRLASDHVDVKMDVLAGSSSRGGPWEHAAKKTDKWRERMHDSGIEELVLDLREILDDPAVQRHLSGLEHRRFVAERLLAGWLPMPQPQGEPGPSRLSTKGLKDILRLNPTLVPFDELERIDKDKDESKTEQAKDDRIVAMMGQVLRMKAKMAARKGPAPG